MDVIKYTMLVDMLTNSSFIKHVYDTYNMFKEDNDFSLFKYIKAALNIMDGDKIIKFENSYMINSLLPPFPSKALFTNYNAVVDKDNKFTQHCYLNRSAPGSFYLSITDNCPLNCFYCSCKNRNNRDREELTTEELIKLISDIQGMGASIIGLTGGEPFTRNDIYDIVDSIDDRSISYIYTSGFNITYDKMKRLKQLGLFGTGISLRLGDFSLRTGEIFNSRSYNMSLNALKASRSSGLYTMGNVVVMKENVNEPDLLKLFKLLYDNGAHEVRIFEPILSGDLFKYDESIDNVILTDQEREELIRIQKKVNKKFRYPKISSDIHSEGKDKFGCGAGLLHSYISSVGDLYPCDFIPMSFGNIREKSIKELWNNMKNNMGGIKQSCLAQSINKKIYDKFDLNIPLSEQDSLKLCKKIDIEPISKYFRTIRGNK